MGIYCRIPTAIIIYNVIGSARLFWHDDQCTHVVVTIHIILLYLLHIICTYIYIYNTILLYYNDNAKRYTQHTHTHTYKLTVIEWASEWRSEEAFRQGPAATSRVFTQTRSRGVKINPFDGRTMSRSVGPWSLFSVQHYIIAAIIYFSSSSFFFFFVSVFYFCV